LNALAVPHQQSAISESAGNLAEGLVRRVDHLTK
jgi:hypothetical protein